MPNFLEGTTQIKGYRENFTALLQYGIKFVLTPVHPAPLSLCEFRGFLILRFIEVLLNQDYFLGRCETAVIHSD